jgi:micrococcal nuclease
MYHYRCELRRVVDGDTVDVLIDLGFGINLKERVRLIGLDTPEMRSSDPMERTRARAATKFVENWFATHDSLAIRTRFDRRGKYGRVLGEISGHESKGDVWKESVLNASLLESKHAELI